MTVRELIADLCAYPEDMEVLLKGHDGVHLLEEIHTEEVDGEQHIIIEL